MDSTTEALRAPDGTLMVQTDKQTFIFELFFDHNGKDTFQDKLVRVMLTEDTTNGVFIPVSSLPKQKPRRAEVAV